MVYFKEQRFLTLMKYTFLLLFYFLVHLLCPKKYLPSSKSQIFSPMFLSGNLMFYLLCFSLWSIWVNFYIFCEIKGLKLILCVWCLVVIAPFVADYPSAIELTLYFLKINWLCMRGFISRLCILFHGRLTYYMGMGE